MPPFFTVEGGHQLRGTVQPSGNKNAALPVLAAALLADGPVVLHNVPRIRDVETLIELLQSLGAAVRWHALGFRYTFSYTSRQFRERNDYQEYGSFALSF